MPKLPPPQSNAHVHRPPTFRAGEPGVALVVTLVDAAIVAGTATDRLPLVAALVGHGLIVALLVLRLAQQWRRRSDIGPLLLLIPATLFLGPCGAFGGVIIGWLSRRGTDDVARLEDWYRRLSLSTQLDPTARLADHVLTGRALDFTLHPNAPMSDLVQHGTIGQKQAILGLVARRFHPDYLPTLRIALVSEEPIIRVQAAAVAAKIRGDMPKLVDQLLKDASDSATPPELIVERMREVRLCASSGLMEEKDRERTERLIDGQMARTMLRLERSMLSQGRLNSALATVQAFEAHLLASERFSDLRRLRRARLWAKRGPWSFRPLQRAPRMAAGQGGAP